MRASLTYTAFRLFSWACVAWLVCGLKAAAWASEGGDAMRFDIPAQPLAAALRQYAGQTGKSVFIESALVAGKQSVAVVGEFAPAPALLQLLTGSGLRAVDISATAFTLVARDEREASAAPSVAPLPPTISAMRPDDASAAQWQRSLERALCASRLTYPGSYRALIRIWLNERGNVRRGGLLGSTGMPERDKAIDATLARTVFGAPAPALLEQPLIILLLPRTAGVVDVCQLQGDD